MSPSSNLPKKRFPFYHYLSWRRKSKNPKSYQTVGNATSTMSLSSHLPKNRSIRCSFLSVSIANIQRTPIWNHSHFLFNLHLQLISILLFTFELICLASMDGWIHTFVRGSFNHETFLLLLARFATRPLRSSAPSPSSSRWIQLSKKDTIEQM